MDFLSIQNCLVLELESYQPKPRDSSLFYSSKNKFEKFSLSFFFKGKENEKTEERESKIRKYLLFVMEKCFLCKKV